MAVRIKSDGLIQNRANNERYKLMNKLIPIKSCVLTTGKNASGETFHTAKLTVSLDDNAVGVISVSVAKANALPASWRLAEGIKPSISKVEFTRWDGNLKAFIPCASEGQADRSESLVSLGYVGLRDEDLAHFSTIRKETGKKGQVICHLKRVADGQLHIERLPWAVEEAGVEVSAKE